MGILTAYVSQVYKYLKISTNPQSLPNRHCKFYRVPEESCNSPLFEGSDRRVNLWGLRLTTMPKTEVPTLGHKCPFHPFFYLQNGNINGLRITTYQKYLQIHKVFPTDIANFIVSQKNLAIPRCSKDPTGELIFGDLGSPLCLKLKCLHLDTNVHSIHFTTFKMGILTAYVLQVYKYLKISTNPQSLPNRHCKFYRVPEESCNSPLFEGSDRGVNLWGLRLTNMPEIEVPTLGHKCPFHPFFYLQNGNINGLRITGLQISKNIYKSTKSAQPTLQILSCPRRILQFPAVRRIRPES
ncbi:uncharacterized protein LOC109612758 [Musca domestica]|uniref:Uncharacterized protein LOC109612758 n=1 Tax=Musca domestica TaxID=7370 RepID=A0ABM3UMZ7_MUSDO|nr:uncharacterized protein LOC109612758 [Musca domestica]